MNAADVLSTTVHVASNTNDERVLSTIDEFLTSLSDLLDVDIDEAMNRLLDDTREHLVRECSMQLIEMIGVRIMSTKSIDNDIERYSNIISYLVDMCSTKESMLALIDLLQRMNDVDSSTTRHLFCIIASLIRKPLLSRYVCVCTRFTSNFSRDEYLVDVLTLMIDYCQRRIPPSYDLENDECIAAENCSIANNSQQAVDSLLQLMTTFVDECVQCTHMDTNRRRQRSRMLTLCLLRIMQRPIIYWHVPDSTMSSDYRRCASHAVHLIAQLSPNRMQLYDNKGMSYTVSNVIYITDIMSSLSDSACCLGVLEYFCRIQQCDEHSVVVYSHRHQLDVCLSSCVALLTFDTSHTAVCIKATSLLIALLHPIANETIDRHVLAHQTYQQLVHALTQLILQCSTSTIRQQSLHCFEHLLRCLQPNGQLAVIRFIFYRDGWQLPNRMKLFGWLIDFYRKRLPLTVEFIDELPWLLSVFCRISTDNIVNDFDMHMATLNLLRMLVLNRHRYAIQKTLFDAVDQVYLVVLNDELMSASREYHLIDDDMYASALLSIELMHSVLLRVRELIHQ